MSAILSRAASRVATVLLACVVTCALTAGMSGCSQSEEQVRAALIAGIQSDIAELTSLTSESAVALFPSEYTQSLQAAQVDPLMVYGPLYEDITYGIGAVDVAEDSATVELTVENKDLTAALQTYTATLTNELATQAGRDTLGALDEAELNRHMAGVLAQCIEETTGRVSNTLVLVYQKDGGSWVLQNPAELTTALLGGLDVDAVALPSSAQLADTEAAAAANLDAVAPAAQDGLGEAAAA